MLHRIRFIPVLAILLVLMASPSARADSWSFSLLPPDGAISGPAGATIGWGYNITNNSATDWLVLTGLNSDNFQNGTPDSSYFDLPILAPGANLMTPFDATSFSGLFALTWDLDAPVGFVNTGTFVLSAEFWDNDPLAGGNFVATADNESAAYSATVSPASTVPEPATAFLALAGAAMVALKRRSTR
jgi:PEP-CTERM motif